MKQSLIPNKVLVEWNQLGYLYLPESDQIVALGDAALEKRHLRLSPDHSKIAFSQGKHDQPHTAIAIANIDGSIVMETEIPSLLQQDTFGIVDLRWMYPDKLLVGLMFNTYRWGYFEFDLSKREFAKHAINVKYGTENLVVMKGGHLLHIPPYDNPVNQHLNPQIILDDHILFELTGEHTQIAGLIVDETVNWFASPIFEGGKYELLASQIDVNNGKLVNANRLPMDIARNGTIELGTYNFNTHTGYFLVSFPDGDREIDEISFDQHASSTMKLAEIGREIAISRIESDQDRVRLIDASGNRYRISGGSLQTETDPNEEIQRYLTSKLRDTFPNLEMGSTTIMRLTHIDG
jgi:hypothetical protein